MFSYTCMNITCIIVTRDYTEILVDPWNVSSLQLYFYKPLHLGRGGGGA